MKKVQKISDGMICAALKSIHIPAKKITPTTMAVYTLVKRLKCAEAGKWTDETVTESFDALKEILDASIRAGDFTAFNEFAKFWKEITVKPVFMSKSAPQAIACAVKPGKPLREIASAIVEAVAVFQSHNDRAPTRPEIMEYLEKTLPKGIDDTELSRQLKRLGWQELIPKVADLAL